MNLSDTELTNLTHDQVLSLSREDKLEYFVALQVKHQKLEDIGKNIMRLLNANILIDILFVIGATGVGKTTLVTRLIKSLIEKLGDPAKSCTSDIPFLYFEVAANGNRSLSWSSTYVEILKLGREILINKKESTEVDNGILSVVPRRYRDLGVLREALESMLLNRHVKVLVIDEAFHLLRFGNYTAVMDTLKSLVNRTGTKLVLLGTYDLFDLASEYGQVARRAEIVHFWRYRHDDEADRGEFKRIIRKFQERWPYSEVPTFTSIHEELMEASLGCVGLLKAILIQALDLQLENRGKWNPLFMARATKSVKLLEKIRKEINDGEEKVRGAAYGESIFNEAALKTIVDKMTRKVANG